MKVYAIIIILFLCVYLSGITLDTFILASKKLYTFDFIR